MKLFEGNLNNWHMPSPSMCFPGRRGAKRRNSEYDFEKDPMPGPVAINMRTWREVSDSELREVGRVGRQVEAERRANPPKSPPRKSIDSIVQERLPVIPPLTLKVIERLKRTFGDKPIRTIEDLQEYFRTRTNYYLQCIFRDDDETDLPLCISFANGSSPHVTLYQPPSTRPLLRWRKQERPDLNRCFTHWTVEQEVVYN